VRIRRRQGLRKDFSMGQKLGRQKKTYRRGRPGQVRRETPARLWARPRKTLTRGGVTKVGEDGGSQGRGRGALPQVNKQSQKNLAPSRKLGLLREVVERRSLTASLATPLKNWPGRGQGRGEQRRVPLRGRRIGKLAKGFAIRRDSLCANRHPKEVYIQGKSESYSNKRRIKEENLKKDLPSPQNKENEEGPAKDRDFIWETSQLRTESASACRQPPGAGTHASGKPAEGELGRTARKRSIATRELNARKAREENSRP